MKYTLKPRLHCCTEHCLCIYSELDNNECVACPNHTKFNNARCPWVSNITPAKCESDTATSFHAQDEKELNFHLLIPTQTLSLLKHLLHRYIVKDKSKKWMDEENAWEENLLWMVLKLRAGTLAVFIKRGNTRQQQNKTKPSLPDERKPAAALYNIFTLEHKFHGFLPGLWSGFLFLYVCRPSCIQPTHVL